MSGALQVFDQIDLFVRVSFGLNHIRAAAMFARRCALIESQFNGAYSEAADVELQANSSASIMSSVAFLEASINELFDNSRNNRIVDASQRPVSQSYQQRLAVFNDQFNRQAGLSTLNRYRLASICFDATPVPLGSNPGQDTQLLILIRNALVHYTPEDIDVQGDPQQIITRANGRFSQNPFAAAINGGAIPSFCN